MVTVKFDKSEDGKTLILTIKGHSGQAEIGHDLVCASVSILAYTLAEAVRNMRTDGRLRKEPNIKMDSGDAVITCKPSKGYYTEALQAYKFAELGYSLLAHDYPDYVRLISAW